MLKLVKLFTHGRYKGIVRYIIIGGSTFALDFALLVVFKSVLGFNLYVAATFAYFLALIYNFYFNRRWTFGAKDNLQVHAVLYGILIAVNYVITLGLLDWLGSLGVPYEIAKILSIFPILAWNYVAYKYIFALRARHNPKDAPASATEISA